MKLEKVGEIKRINAQMMAIRSEISKYEDTLKEYQLYKKFLEALTPKVMSHMFMTAPQHMYLGRNFLFNLFFILWLVCNGVWVKTVSLYTYSYLPKMYLKLL